MPTLLERVPDTLGSPGVRRMSEEEFEAWATSEIRAEFVDGEVFEMSPVITSHALIQSFLHTLLRVYLDETDQGEVLLSDVTARLRPGLRRVPDLLYATREHSDRIRERYVEGAPDAVFEIVSEDSVDRDWRDKFAEYEAAGVGEYWIIDPAHRRLQLYVLSQGRFASVEPQEGWVASTVILGFKLRPDWLWLPRPPKVRECLRQIGVAI